ncbi:MAG TPA: hypothetical protein VMV49_06410 [Candidatus Deferrimicrobium sp.]|nr:hypothetical protein [Candidatus Deferrimicrobium sp.]
MKLEHFYSSSLTFTQHVLAGITDSKIEFPVMYIPIQRAQKVAQLDMELKAQELMIQFESILGTRKFKYIVVGAPSGGIAQFCMALDAPFLPCHFLQVPIYRRYKFLLSNDPDDIANYYEASMKIVDPIIKNNENCNAIMHYDPIHDRPLVSTCHTLRFKYRSLPQAYQDFILNHLEENGTVLFTHIQQTWPQFIINDRTFFQVGGADGIQPEEYLNGSEKIDAWAKEMDIDHTGGWNLNDCGVGTFERKDRPESEWGNPPELKEDTQAFCEDHKLNFLCLTTDDYNLPGILGTYAFYRKFEKSHLKPRGIALEIYTATFYSAIPRSRYLPLWAVFPPIGSYNYISRFLKQILGEFPDIPHQFALTTIPAGFLEQKYHFTDSITFKEWKDLLLQYTEYPKNLTVIHYKGDQITYGTVKIILSYPKLYKDAWKWGQQFSLEPLLPLEIEDIKWAANRANLQILKT